MRMASVMQKTSTINIPHTTRLPMHTSVTVVEQCSSTIKVTEHQSPSSGSQEQHSQGWYFKQTVRQGKIHLNQLFSCLRY